MSGDGLDIAERIALHIERTPCLGFTKVTIFAPARLRTRWPDSRALGIGDIKAGIAERFADYRAHIILGAAGLAVRLIAPLVDDKRRDPAVLVVDSQGQFVISLLSGHLGGANDLTRKVAAILNAQPVITTTSDQKNMPALDLCFHHEGLRPIDVDEMAPMQARFLENMPPACYDPMHLLQSLHCRKADSPECAPLICLDWKKHAKMPDRLRVLVPCVLGAGCRRNADPDIVARAINIFLAEHTVDENAVVCLASVSTKADEPALRDWAETRNIPFHTVDPITLSAVKTPNPSLAAGTLFGTKPFSVAEAAAQVMCARLLTHTGTVPVLALQKQSFFHAVTLALSCPTAVTGAGRKEETCHMTQRSLTP